MKLPNKAVSGSVASVAAKPEGLVRSALAGARTQVRRECRSQPVLHSTLHAPYRACTVSCKPERMAPCIRVPPASKKWFAKTGDATIAWSGFRCLTLPCSRRNRL